MTTLQLAVGLVLSGMINLILLLEVSRLSKEVERWRTCCQELESDLETLEAEYFRSTEHCNALFAKHIGVIRTGFVTGTPASSKERGAS